MAINLSVNVDKTRERQIQKALSKLDNNKDMHRALARAKNDTGYWFRDQVLRAVGKDLGITKTKDRLKRRTRAKTNRNHNKFSTWDIWLKQIPLHTVVPESRLRITPRKLRRQRNQPGFAYKGTTYKGAFLTRGTGGKEVVIKRKGNARYPTETVGFDETRAVTMSAINRLEGKLDDRFLTQLRRSVRAILRKVQR